MSPFELFLFIRNYLSKEERRHVMETGDFPFSGVDEYFIGGRAREIAGPIFCERDDA